MTRIQSLPRESGFSLVVVLVFMLVLIMIGITGMQASGLQERMAGHSRDRSIAFQAAEAALRAGETSVRTLSGDGSSSCANGFCAVDNTQNPFNATSWSDARSKAVDRNTAESGLSTALAQDPRYYIESLGYQPLPGYPDPVHVFRVTARATGQNKATVVILQSTIF